MSSDTVFNNSTPRCSHCGGPLVVAGRTTHYYYCPACERAVDPSTSTGASGRRASVIPCLPLALLRGFPAGRSPAGGHFQSLPGYLLPILFTPGAPGQGVSPEGFVGEKAPFSGPSGFGPGRRRTRILWDAPPNFYRGLCRIAEIDHGRLFHQRGASLEGFEGEQ
jgi:hypothetical protein